MDDFDTLYRAMASRDARFDGRFVVAVTSTGVYCRPSCPSRTPLAANVRFFPLAAAARAAGFRPCRRCRPDTVPPVPAAGGAAAVAVRGPVTPPPAGLDDGADDGGLVQRALRLIADGVVDRDGVAGLARRLSVSERHLHRRVYAEVGAGPQALAVSRRAQVARTLVESSALPLAEVAFAAGYASIRQFNAGMRAAYGCPPGALRRGSAVGVGGDLTLRLAYREPLPFGPLLGWLAERAIPGVETVTADRYRRRLRLAHGTAQVEVRFAVERPGEALLRLRLADVRDVAAAVRRVRAIFDLDADPGAIATDLGADPVLAPLLARLPGLRVPGCADGFECAARTVLSGTGAPRPTVARLVARYGDGGLFPTAAELATADLSELGARAARLRALAGAVADGRLVLERGVDRATTVAALRSEVGVGPAAAAHLATHALGDPDVFAAADPALRRALAWCGGDPSRWRPWRSYAAAYLTAPG